MLRGNTGLTTSESVSFVGDDHLVDRRRVGEPNMCADGESRRSRCRSCSVLPGRAALAAALRAAARTDPAPGLRLPDRQRPGAAAGVAFDLAPGDCHASPDPE